MRYLGLGKTLFNSSACLLETQASGAAHEDIRSGAEIVLTERMLREKASGTWPEKALRTLLHDSYETLNRDGLEIAENRDVTDPHLKELALDRAFPFFAHLESAGLAHYSRQFNKQIQFTTHHLCHASAATFMSPFEKALIMVIDGAGSAFADFTPGSEEQRLGHGEVGDHEECTVYKMENGMLTPVFKRWRKFQTCLQDPKRTFSQGVGIFYENIAEYIFNSGRAAGKVMGLAPFGKALPVDDRVAFLESLNWKNAFSKKGRFAWEASDRFQEFADLAASAQASFEDELIPFICSLRERYPGFENLILTGGCALNCTMNAKLLKIAGFAEIYVPPFPGDECISLGAASSIFLRKEKWRAFTSENQHGYFGPKSSVPTAAAVAETFSGFKIERPASITDFAAELIANGEVIAWFQGRSESGPRALGNRSILARPDLPGLKDTLNRRIKFREDFRPYGCSCLHETAQKYFDVTPDFNNPYMSFAVQVRADARERLKQVTHIDGTSRMQTVRSGQNRLFHELLTAVGKKTGLGCVLNTSLNIMGEPIVESLEDAREFLLKIPVRGLVIGDYWIQRPDDNKPGDA